MVTVGIDPHKKTHTAVVVDAAGRKVGRALTVADTADAAWTLIAWVAQRCPGQPVTFAIEDGRGLARRLANALVVAGQTTLWVPVRLVVEKRRKGGPRGKSDPIDALAAAKAAQDPDNARYLSQHSLDEPGRDLRYLVDERRDLTTHRTRVINQLRWRIHEYDPDVEPASLTTLKGPRQLIAAVATRSDGVLGEVIARTTSEVLDLTQRINTLTADITARVADVAPTLLARPGVGPIVAATIIGELGDPTRIRNGAALARLSGIAPIPVWTSNNTQVRLDRGGNRRLNAMFHTIALTQARYYPPAQKLIAKHRDAKGAKGALRVIKRHLTDAIYDDLMKDFTAEQNAKSIVTSELIAA